MNGAKWVYVAIIGVAVVVAITAGILVVTSVGAQDSLTAEPENRLEEKGLPVEAVKVISRLPFTIEIEIASDSETDLLTVEDLYNRIIAQREASLYHWIGNRIDRFSILIAIRKGKWSPTLPGDATFPSFIGRIKKPALNLTCDNTDFRSRAG